MPTKGQLEKRDWTMLAIALADGNQLSPVQLQKSLFLFKERLPKAVLPRKFYKFIPYNYGPFCREVYSDARSLEEQALVMVTDSLELRIRQYAATPAGIRKGKSIADTLPQEVVNHGREIVRWTTAQSFKGLVSAIYREYPKYMANSIFKG